MITSCGTADHWPLCQPPGRPNWIHTPLALPPGPQVKRPPPPLHPPNTTTTTTLPEHRAAPSFSPRLFLAALSLAPEEGPTQRDPRNRFSAPAGRSPTQSVRDPRRDSSNLRTVASGRASETEEKPCDLFFTPAIAVGAMCDSVRALRTLRLFVSPLMSLVVAVT